MKTNNQKISLYNASICKTTSPNEQKNLKKNEIPDIDVVAEENPILVRKLKNLIDIVSLNQATGEQKGVILNFLVTNIDTVNIPVEYKKEIIKNLQ